MNKNHYPHKNVTV